MLGMLMSRCRWRPKATVFTNLSMLQCKTGPWDIIGLKAETEFGDETGMSPWWTMPGANLKRHLFALPQSRDIDRFARLKSQRLLYRLALGQPDQEDLVELLSNHSVVTACPISG